MKATIKTKPLLEALNTVGLATLSSTLPILSNVMVDAADGSITLAATNLEIYITKRIEASVGKAGRVCVPFKILSLFLARAAASETSMKLNDKILEVVCGEAVANLETLPADEFPPNLDLGAGVIVIECAAEEITKPLRMVSHAISSEPAHYTLNGTCIKSTKAGTDFVATNGQRMAMYRSSDLKTKDVNVIVPEIASRIFLKTISSGPVTLSITEAGVGLVNSGVEIRTKLIEGRFPNYETVIPEPGKNVFSALREELLGAITTAALFLQNSDMAISIAGKKKEIEIACRERGRVKIVGTELSGQPDVTVLFNHKYVRDVLTAMSSEAVRIEHSEHSPLTFREGCFLAVVQPMALPAA